ncbi:MAG TPA: tRNA epoxyqueuosine(34) reductase QueG [Polyangiaceae bacterium]|nr:tRNA epoxyqueuosine(34) reductase QueG [Polyangiaceae bacterium]
MIPVITPSTTGSAQTLPDEVLPDLALPAGAARHDPGVHVADPLRSPTDLAEAIREAALALGFGRVGFCPIEPFVDAERAFEHWLAQGHHGEMAFMTGQSRSAPSELLPRAKTLIVVALAYDRGGAPAPSVAASEGAPQAAALLSPRALVARYARGADYHGVMKERLRILADRCAELAGRPVLARPCVDTAPLLEREAARRAGIGFTAKNTMTIAPGLGSYVLLGELLVDIEITPTRANQTAGCGSCRSCLDACPTGAFVDAYTLDARRCISYLTIELRGPIPRELRPAIGRWVFGCDICQEVCPFNHSPKARAGDPALAPRAGTTDLELCALLSLGSAGHRRLVRNSALKRINRASLQRNAAVALGNSGAPSVVPALATALRDNPSALVRGHVAWALGRIGTDAARDALTEARERETDAFVLQEIALALPQ